jgi:hypothetical protein
VVSTAHGYKVKNRTSIAASGAEATGVARADPRMATRKTSENFMFDEIQFELVLKGDSSLAFIGVEKGQSIVGPIHSKDLGDH